MIKPPDLPYTVPSSLFFVFTVGNTLFASNLHSPRSGFIPLQLIPSAKDRFVQKPFVLFPQHAFTHNRNPKFVHTFFVDDVILSSDSSSVLSSLQMVCISLEAQKAYSTNRAKGKFHRQP